jgi:hypothetical protein
MGTAGLGVKADTSNNDTHEGKPFINVVNILVFILTYMGHDFNGIKAYLNQAITVICFGVASP